MDLYNYREFAAKRSVLQQFTLGTARQIEDGKPIKVFGLRLGFLGTGAIAGIASRLKMQTGDGSETLMSVLLGNGSAVTPVIIDIPFIADKGLRFVVEANFNSSNPSHIQVVVYHTNIGE